MINNKALVARINEEMNKLDPVVKLADELFLSGLRESDVNWRLLNKYVPNNGTYMFRNRIRDLEKGIKKPGEK